MSATLMPLPPLARSRPDEEWFQPDPATRLQARQVARELDYDEVIATRLVMLGMSAQEVTDYLNPAPQHILDPERTVPGMNAAAAALSAGVAAGEVVGIYSDYDVDGQTSMAILSSTLEEYGAKLHTGSANAVTGFGLTRAFVEEAHAAGAKWLITVDCGSTQVDPVKLAQSLGMRVIIIDHHDVDTNNSAQYHLNPRLIAAQALQRVCVAVEVSACRQKLPFIGPYDTQLEKLTPRSVGILTEFFGEEEWERIRADILDNSHPTNTGAILTWKFAAAFHQRHHRLVPSSHWGTPLYLAGLGAIADLAPCNDMEIRAFVRVATNTQLQRDYFGNGEAAPVGLSMLARALGERVERVDQLVRTRALLNLPKRTREITPESIQTILRSTDLVELGALIPCIVSDYERLSSIRREQMDQEALAQVAAEVEAGQRAEDEDVTGEAESPWTYFAYAVLDGFEDYAGYTRMVANTLCKATGKPAVVFACKSADDEFGQRLYKFSAANNVLPECHLGDLIHDQSLRAACVVRMYDWLGEPADIVNLGGHTAVVSGVVHAENIKAAQACFEAWAKDKDRRGDWRPIERKRPRVAQRKVSGRRLRRLEREAELLYPLSFPTNPALQVSVCGTFQGISFDEQAGCFQAMLALDDGTERPVKLADDLAVLIRTHPQQRFEVVLALGGTGSYFVSEVARA
jgi:single-stranded DNA-specific DHH superfamily exonuclease